jgi:hypothetical protein
VAMKSSRRTFGSTGGSPNGSARWVINAEASTTRIPVRG